MIHFKTIIDTDQKEYHLMEKLLTAAFPKEEYRELAELRAYTVKHPLFHNIAIYDQENFIGLITYWDFDSFYYIEHFATDARERNKGYGQQILSLLTAQLKRPIVLEVELPNDEYAKRRIEFYKRNGFVLWEKEYSQPPYRSGEQELPMALMVQGSLDPEEDYKNVREKLYTEVYGVR